MAKLNQGYTNTDYARDKAEGEFNTSTSMDVDTTKGGRKKRRHKKTRKKRRRKKRRKKTHRKHK